MILEDFYKEVLSVLGVLAAEDEATASDRKSVVNKYQQVHAEYSRRDIIPWFDDEDVPDWASDAFAVIIADRLSSKFSLSQSDKDRLSGEALGAITTIIGDGQRRKTNPAEIEFY